MPETQTKTRPPAPVSLLPRWSTGGWYASIPARILLALQLAFLPVRAAGWVLDRLIGAMVLAVLVVVWAWWSHRIPDATVHAVMQQVGSRLLGLTGHDFGG